MKMSKHQSRLIAVLLSLSLLLTFGAGISLPAAAEVADPIPVATAADLIAIADGNLAGNYILTADIDLTDQAFLPIGSPDAPFTGTFDGDGYKISGLNLETDQDYQGLFGVNNGVIRNVTLTDDCYISGSANVGAIAGRNNGTIEDCLSDATVAHYGVEELEASVYNVMCQNLCQWGDDALASNSSYVDSTTHSRRPGMISRIRNVNPDVICFQEVSFSSRVKSGKTISGWDAFLKAQLTDYSFFGDYRSDSDKEGVTVAYKTDKFNCLDGGMFWLSDNPDAPRSQQRPAWGAGCVRTCAWVLLEDKVTGEQMAVYSAHLDHVEAASLARANGAKVIAQKMEALKVQYPDVMFMVAGDFNEEPGNAGYNATDEIFDGMMDDARYAYQGEPSAVETIGDINDPLSSEKTIDFIFTDSATIQVTDFKVLTDYYNNFRPSDHHGLLAKIERIQNSSIGGIVGSNGGTVQRIIARGGADYIEAESVGQVIGQNSGTVSAVYSYSVEDAIGGGKMSGIRELPLDPKVQVVAALNKEADRGAFNFVENEYVVVGNKVVKTPVCLTVNGEDFAVYPGDEYTIEDDFGIEDPAYFLNGVWLKSTTFIIPPEGGVLNVAGTVSSVESAVTQGEYTIKSIEDWMYLFEHQSYFASRDITIQLLCDIDLSDEKAAIFTTFLDPAFSFNGQGNTVKNWGTAEAPVDRVGLFAVKNGAGGMNFIKNLNVENCHIWDTVTDGAGTTLVYAVFHGNAGMEGLPTRFYMENVHVKDCSLGSSQTEACAFLLSRYGVPGKEILVYLENCSVRDSVLDANNMDHKGLLIGKVRSNAAGKQANFYMEDCIVEGNTIKNSNGYTGFVLGNIEGTGVDAYLKNVGIFNNTSSGTNDGAIIGHMNQGGIVCEGVLMQGNTLNQSTKYVIAAQGNNPVNVTTDQIFCDNTDLTGIVEGKSNTLTGGADAVTSGAAGYGVNSILEEPAFWWSLDGEGGYQTTADESKQIRRVSIRSVGVTNTYLNGGETYTLPAEGEYELIEGEATIEENQMVVNMDLVFAKETAITEVTEAVTGGEYDITCLSDFLYLYENISFFRNRDVIIHLRCDLNLSDSAAADFHGFEDPYFSFNGHGFAIKNWGTEESPAEAKALFYAVNGGGLNYIKNLKLENCHLTEYTEDAVERGNNALVYTAHHGNGGQAGLPATLTLEGITIKGCSLVSNYEASALLLGRYTPSGGNHTVEIKNIRVESSTLDAADKDHKGLLVGKPRSNNGGGRAVFNISDCYLYGNTILNAATVNAGFVFGTAEVSSVTVNLNNIGIIGNSIYRSGDLAMIGYADGGIVNMNKILIADNEYSCTSSYLLTTDYHYMSSMTAAEVYTDTALTAGLKYGSASYTASAEKIAKGEANYSINKKLSSPSFFWGMENGLPVPTASANQTAKVSTEDGDGNPLDVFYADGGETVTFTYEDSEYEILSATGGTMDGATLTMPEGGKDVRIKVTEKVCAHLYEDANAVPEGENQHRIPCSYGCGIDHLENCSFGDWSSEERQGKRVHVHSCICSREEVEECTYTYGHVEGTDTHDGVCSTCHDVVEGLACTMRVEEGELPAIGEAFEGTMVCIHACGNTRTQASLIAGDINADGAVTLSDLVCILRIAGDKLDSDLFQGALGNVHKEDPALTTADALLILRHLMNQ